MTTAARIDEAVQRYGRLPKDFNDIHGLTYAVQFLSTELAKYANELADLFSAWRAAEFKRKAAYELERADQLNRGVPASKADALARNTAISKLGIETDAEIAYTITKNPLRSGAKRLEGYAATRSNPEKGMGRFLGERIVF